jgi:putative hydrolase of the HAD superfamily
MSGDRLATPGAVTFDCWNTLLFEDDWRHAHALRIGALLRAAAEAGRGSSEPEAGRAFDAAWRRHMALWERGFVSGAREVAIWALEELGLHEPHPALEHLVRSYEEAAHTSQVRALPGALDTLVALARAGIHRALICDTGLTPGRVVRQHLARLGLLEHLEIQIFSDEIGVPKPNPRVFRAALDPLGVEPPRALHVGDLRRTDVAGARAVGMAAIRIRELHDDATELPEADFVVDSHAELRTLLALEDLP